ncbi:hypothetical protein GIY21_16325 [Xanthomonas sontii]|uniref:Novel STAND NTPase 5 domain-containing protein n=1 Tax=Xanthomonas sontii TaxID=2650745 RepID=A0A6N7QC24_9XANT|nr:SIR2 family protein [Xanthomonas sontii]MRH01864.1 hypothetical protein [Xanthomonas sontii]MRH76081.1 hypothetical protein [Xanthomonas sontii]
MNKNDEKIIREQIVPLLGRGELSLLLGAGFSIMNEGAMGRLPGGEDLRDLILKQMGKAAGAKTTLKDAYLAGKRSIPDFEEFMSSCFTISKAFSWQERMFQYAWSRIYTTNIDNVLNVAWEAGRKKGRLGGDFIFFNYCDPKAVADTIGSIPVITIHGTCLRLNDGFVFSSLEYAKVTSKMLDWHRDLAAKSLTGGLLVIGNQLEESDFDAYIAGRQASYGEQDKNYSNWIVMPDPDEIKADNYRAAGYYVIDAKAEQFFDFLFSQIAPKSIGEIVVETIPAVKKAASHLKAMTWFKGAFNPVITELEDARNEKGILRHFLTGDEPEWFYIVNEAHAHTSREGELTVKIGDMMQNGDVGIGILHVTGPSGSGKTTAIRSALRNVVGTYRYAYEFNERGGIDTDLYKEVLSRFTEKSIFIFYSAAEYYFAVNYMHHHFVGKELPYCLFILEDRNNEYRKNRAQLRQVASPQTIEISELSKPDAALIAKRIEDGGLVFENFSQYPLDRRASIIMDKERGYGGDLLSALFSLTTHENFERKIYRDYASVSNVEAQRILDVVAIVNSFGFGVPVSYLAGMVGVAPVGVTEKLSDDLAGVLVNKGGSVRCRHRVIAQYYFDNCVSGKGSADSMIEMLTFLSRQFSVEDIRRHPLPYRIYKELISFEFLYDKYLPRATRKMDAEKIFHEAQVLFGRDGIFWLQFGRYYRKVGDLENAIDCFRTGLEFYESFQTKHSLGVALLDKYIEDGCSDPAVYGEGVAFLEAERLRRGSSDPYPTVALVSLLAKIIKENPALLDARVKIKECLNFGIKHFSDDHYFSRQLKGFIKGKDY